MPQQDETENIRSAVMSEGIQSYLRTAREKAGVMMILLALLAATFLISLYLGTTVVTMDQILGNIFSQDGTWEGYVIHDIRLRRACAAIIAGCGLGVAGAAMQCVLRNPLGSPYTLGLSNAAAFGAALGIMVLGGGVVTGQSVAGYSIDDPYLVTLSAFAFSVLATGVIAACMKFLNASPETMVLSGMAMSAIFSAGIAFLQYQADDMALSAIVFWQFGDLEKIEWTNMPLVFFGVLLPCLYLYLKRWDLNAIDMGDDTAHGLGVNVGRTRIIVLVVSALMTALIVSFVGIIGFIGLLAPHVARRLVGDDKRALLPASAIIGALVLLIAMLLGENAFSFSIPVGIVTSLVGGPLFMWILLSKHKKRRLAR